MLVLINFLRIGKNATNKVKLKKVRKVSKKDNVCGISKSCKGLVDANIFAKIALIFLYGVVENTLKVCHNKIKANECDTYWNL